MDIGLIQRIVQWLRKNRANASARPETASRAGFEFESIESRVLFSADIAVIMNPGAGLSDINVDQPAAIEASILETSTTRSPGVSDTVAIDTSSTELVFIDAGVEDSDRLLADLLSGDGTERRVEVYVLDGKRDGIEQISEVLAGYTGLDAVHIISHGSDGQVQLGSGALDAAALAANSQSVNNWGNALSLDADLLLYGCNLAASEAGQSLVTTLAGLTGADVAASNDLTGSAALGGDWTLEYTTGHIESGIAISEQAQVGWSNTLAVASLTASADTYIDDGASGINYGDSTSLVIDHSGGDIGNVRALMQFDLGSIPAGATITSATLQLEATSNTGAFDINVYEVTEAWVEGSGNGTADAASWDARQPSVAWSTPGGTYDPTIIATLNTSLIGQHSWDITSLVTAWYGGSTVNNGIIIGSPDGGGDVVTYDSSEGATPPTLVITYTGGNSAPTGSVTIDNASPAQGDTLTAANTLADADGLSGAISYQWQRDGSNIGGATGASYTTTQADVGAVITVIASYTDDLGTAESVASTATAAVTNVNDAPTGSVTIDKHQPAQGDTLTASNTLADADGLSGAISYQWQRDGSNIGGATGASYTTTQADVGARHPRGRKLHR